VTQANPLITVDELARLLAGAEVSLLDVRWRLGGPPGIDLYLAGHIPGAVLADLDRDLAAPPGRRGPGGRHPMPAAADFEAAMRRAGVGDDRPVVVYDDADSTSAARAWWLLRYFGHPSVRVLDGGYRAWTAAGRQVESGPGAAGAPASPGGPSRLGGPVPEGAPRSPIPMPSGSPLPPRPSPATPGSPASAPGLGDGLAADGEGKRDSDPGGRADADEPTDGPRLMQ